MGVNYIGVTRGAQVTGVAVAALSLTWISMVLRFYVRAGMLKFFGKEDWLTMGAVVIFTVFCALVLRTTAYGLGAHMYNISEGSLVTGFKITFICELLYVVSTTVTKLSIATFYIRLASKHYQSLIIYLNTSFVLIFSSMYFFFLLFQCSPITYLWSRYESGHGKCLHDPILPAVTYAHCIMSALTDWVFGILPIFFVWKLRGIDLRTKLSIVLILSLGFFASTATIVRIVYIRSLSETTDYSWEGINLAKWSMVEPAIAITAMNIATLRPLFANIFKSASKRFDPSTMSQGSIGPLGDLKTELISDRSNVVSASEYSAEFAQLLGLSRIGVTTEITAGVRNGSVDVALIALNGGGSSGGGEKGPLSPLKKVFGRKGKRKSLHLDGDSSRWEELSTMPPSPYYNSEASNPGPRSPMDWGIKTTTVIRQEIA